MATIQLRIVPDSGQNITASKTISDVNTQRLVAAAAVMFPGKTPTQALQSILDRIVTKMIDGTKAMERRQAAPSISDIPVT